MQTRVVSKDEAHHRRSVPARMPRRRPEKSANAPKGPNVSDASDKMEMPLGRPSAHAVFTVSSVADERGKRGISVEIIEKKLKRGCL
ncbi:hypothetical protein FGB62_104g039 [Gracilaria domingensis]|nr:hypothetical protein FGB62_104g039 [Gracilaria domingensis]